uniref:hypothetical protein n=1 Tax=Paenibacillus xylanivorans TaxID=1705561 RepID=UPI0038B24025
MRYTRVVHEHIATTELAADARCQIYGHAVPEPANLKATHGVQVYFSAPYSSWQRGSNENAFCENSFLKARISLS